MTRHLKERVKDHNGHDKSSHLVKHFLGSGHNPVCHGNFRILDKSYNNTFKRKATETLLIKKQTIVKCSRKISQIGTFQLTLLCIVAEL